VILQWGHGKCAPPSPVFRAKKEQDTFSDFLPERAAGVRRVTANIMETRTVDSINFPSVLIYLHSNPPCIPAVPPCMKVWGFTVKMHTILTNQ
jgi:hypothetical protein